MSRLALTLAGVDYLDRTGPLVHGEVVPEGIDLNYIVLNIGELFRRASQHTEFDACEFSLSTYMVMRSRGDDRYIGIPVFPARAFRHRAIYVNPESGIETPEDLDGRSVGCREYQQSASMWARAILQHDHGVLPENVHWRYGGIESSIWLERLEHELPPHIRYDRISADKSLIGMLEANELDAVITPATPKRFREGSPLIRRLFQEYETVERAYWERTGVFPIMHLIVIRKDVYEANRWIATSLVRAFEQAKQAGLAKLRHPDILAVGDPWWESEWEEVDITFGGDAFPYGFEANLKTLEAATLYSYEQGLSPRKLDPEELFAPEVLDTMPS